MDSSVCRKSFRLKDGGPIFMTENFRYDVRNGVSISHTLIERKRKMSKILVTQNPTVTDDAVCSFLVQRERFLKRLTYVREIGGKTG